MGLEVSQDDLMASPLSRMTLIDISRLRAVEGHFAHPDGRDWMNITDHVNPLLAELVGDYTARPLSCPCLSSYHRRKLTISIGALQVQNNRKLPAWAR